MDFQKKNIEKNIFKFPETISKDITKIIKR